MSGCAEVQRHEALVSASQRVQEHSDLSEAKQGVTSKTVLCRKQSFVLQLWRSHLCPVGTQQRLSPRG